MKFAVWLRRSPRRFAFSLLVVTLLGTFARRAGASSSITSVNDRLDAQRAIVSAVARGGVDFETLLGLDASRKGLHETLENELDSDRALAVEYAHTFAALLDDSCETRRVHVVDLAPISGVLPGEIAEALIGRQPISGLRNVRWIAVSPHQAVLDQVERTTAAARHGNVTTRTAMVRHGEGNASLPIGATSSVAVDFRPVRRSLHQHERVFDEVVRQLSDAAPEDAIWVVGLQNRLNLLAPIDRANVLKQAAKLIRSPMGDYGKDVLTVSMHVPRERTGLIAMDRLIPCLLPGLKKAGLVDDEGDLRQGLAVEATGEIVFRAHRERKLAGWTPTDPVREGQRISLGHWRREKPPEAVSLLADTGLRVETMGRNPDRRSLAYFFTRNKVGNKVSEIHWTVPAKGLLSGARHERSVPNRRWRKSLER